PARPCEARALGERLSLAGQNASYPGQIFRLGCIRSRGDNLSARRKAQAKQPLAPETSGRKTMRKTLFLSAAVLALSVGAAGAQKPIKIGFVSTFSGPTAVIGNDMRNSFELALDHLGRKIGGQPVEVIYEHDQQKPEVGKQKTEKLIEGDRLDFVIG